MKILIVSHSYAPSETPRAFRWAAIAEWWAAHGHQVDVISAGPATPTVQRSGGPTTVVVRSVIDRFRPHPVNGTSGVLTQEVMNGRRGRSARLARWVHDRTWKRVYWPDYACTWIAPAIRTARSLANRENYDVIVTVSFPFSSHLVGLAVRRKKPNLPWLVDIGDPFGFPDVTPSNNRRLYGRLNATVEERVLAACNAAVVTTDETRDEYVRRLPLAASKLHVIPPMISLVIPDCGPRPDEGVIRLVFAGTLYRHIRSPEYLLEVLSNLPSSRGTMPVELHLVGDISNCGDIIDRYRDRASVKIVLHGLVARERAVQIMMSATAVVNIANDSLYQLPSKVVEYFAVGRPIVNISRNGTDPASRLLARAPDCLNIAQSTYRDPAAAAYRLAAFLADPPVLSSAVCAKRQASFSVEAIARQYEQLLFESLAAKRVRASVVST